MAAYFIFHNIIRDAEKMQEYIPAALATLKPFGGEVVVLDENPEVFEGSTDFSRMVVIKFASNDAATAWYNSTEYQKVRPLRLDATEGFAVLADGFTLPDQ